MAKVKCPKCNFETSQLMNHIYRTHDTVPKLDSKIKSIAQGIVLGDGTVNKNGVIILLNTNKDFLRYTQSVCSPWSGSIHKKRSAGSQTSHKGKIITTNKDFYALTFHRHPFFKQLRNWYSSGKKSFPDNLSLDKHMAKWWYAGDGGLSWNNYKNAFAVITTDIQKYRVKYLKSLFEENGLSASVDGQHIRFTAAETKNFLKWLGEPIPGFEYKWENKNYFNYKNLKGSENKKLNKMLEKAKEKSEENGYNITNEDKRAKEIFDKCEVNVLGSGGANDLLCSAFVYALNENNHSPKIEGYFEEILNSFNSNRSIYSISNKEVRRKFN